jgi:hypothetical protein
LNPKCDVHIRPDEIHNSYGIREYRITSRYRTAVHIHMQMRPEIPTDTNRCLHMLVDARLSFDDGAHCATAVCRLALQPRHGQGNPAGGDRTIATELNLHSVAIAGSVWTIRHDQQEKQLQEPRRSGQQQQQQTAQVTAPREPRKLRRQRRDGERAAAFRARKAAQAPKPQAKEAPPQGEPDERHAPTGTAQQQQQKLGVADAASSPLRAAAAVREGAATAVQSPGAQPKKRGLPRKSPASAKRAARTPTLPPPAAEVICMVPSLM